MNEAKAVHLFCEIMAKREEEVISVRRNLGGLNNQTWIIDLAGVQYLFRIPGEGTELFSDRRLEKEAYFLLEESRISDSVIYLDPLNGLKISLFYASGHVPDTRNHEETAEAMRVLSRLHSLPIRFSRRETHFERIDRYRAIAETVHASIPAAYHGLLKTLIQWRAQLTDLSGQEVRPTHGDFLPGNVLLREGAPTIILDWEFPVMSDPLEDIGTFCHHGDLPFERIEPLLRDYLDRQPTVAEMRGAVFYSATAALMWYGWAAYKHAIEDDPAPYSAFMERSLDYCAAMSRYLQKGIR